MSIKQYKSRKPDNCVTYKFGECDRDIGELLKKYGSVNISYLDINVSYLDINVSYVDINLDSWRSLTLYVDIDDTVILREDMRNHNVLSWTITGHLTVNTTEYHDLVINVLQIVTAL